MNNIHHYIDKYQMKSFIIKMYKYWSDFTPYKMGLNWYYNLNDFQIKFLRTGICLYKSFPHSHQFILIQEDQYRSFLKVN